MNRLAIRKEDATKKFERRAPLNPEHVQEILQRFPDASISVEPGSGQTFERAFGDDLYTQAGATVGSIDDADVILGIKEVAPNHILPNRVYLNFSHTYKGQAHNMPMLRKFMNMGCTIIDYELIVKDVEATEYGVDQHAREVFFGHYAGYAGAVDSLHALGQRLLYEGIKSPFAAVKKAMDYELRPGDGFGDYRTAMQAISEIGEHIRTEGLPESIQPLIIGVTGGGNAAGAVLHVFHYLPHIWIKPEQLLNFNPPAEEAHHNVYLVQFRQHDRIQPRFEQYARKLTVLMNCIKWKTHHERLVTRKFLKDLYAESQPMLRVVGDVSCDPNGSLEICHQTFPDNPIYIYEPGRDDLSQRWDIDRYHVTTHYGVDGHGIVIMAVANLPAEFPRDASNAFSTMLKKFIPELLKADFSQPLEKLDLSRQLKRAVIIHQGKLAPDFVHLAEHVPPRVLLLGAGLMSPGVIDYLTRHGYHVTVADANIDQARRRIAGYKNTCAVHLSVDEQGKEALLHELAHTDIAISLLPAPLHPVVAELCIETRTHLVTASYASPEMRKLDARAKAAGVILLNEVGLDPGLDHMSAMRVIDHVHASGGTITRFTSYCGGLPHPDAADNPLRFKASWSPAGIVSAANRPARVLQDGAIQAIVPRKLFENPLLFNFEGIPFPLEAYPNGDSEIYLHAYGLSGEAKTFIRGTLRYEGWCEVISWLHTLGWFTDQSAAEVSRRTASEANIPADVRTVLEWLELTTIESDSQPANAVLLSRFQSRPDLGYAPGERDLVVMRHTFDVRYPDNRAERILSSLVIAGETDGLSAMASTVGLTCAISARLIAEKRYVHPGVQVPLTADIYEPVLDEMAAMGFAFQEEVFVIS